MNKIVLLCLLLLLIIAPTIKADCDEERIRVTLTELINAKVNEIKQNTDNSFQAYEQFNTQQLAGFLNKNESQLQQVVLVGVIALFSIVLFTSSMWGWIRIRREKITMMHILDEVRTERKFLEEFIKMFNMNPDEIRAEIEVRKRQRMPEQQKVPQIEPVNLPKKEKKGLFGRKKKQESEHGQQVQAQQQSSPSITPEMHGQSVPPVQTSNQPVHPVQQFVEKPATDAQVMEDMMRYYKQQEAYQKQIQEYHHQQELLKQRNEQEEKLNKLKAELESMYKEKEEPKSDFGVKIETHEPEVQRQAKDSASPEVQKKAEVSASQEKKPVQKPAVPKKKGVKKDESGSALSSPDYNITYDV